MPDNTLTDQLKQSLPADLRESPQLAPQLARVAELEAQAARAELERAFLERAPREGLLHPGDALKLEDLHAAVGADREAGLSDYFARLRGARPWLFARQPAAGAQKLSDGAVPELERLRQSMTHGALTRQLQAVRVKRRG